MTEIISIIASSLDGERDVVSLLTDHFEITDLAFHRISIYLTHVPASIGLPYFPYVKEPRSVVAVGNRDSVILRDHVARYRQNGLRIDTQPCHLRKTNKINIIIMYAVVLIANYADCLINSCINLQIIN